MARPPRRPVDPRDRRVAAIFIATVIGFAIVAFAVAFWPRDDDESGTTSTAVPPTAAPTLPPASPTAPLLATPTPEIVADDCAGECLVRLTDDEPVRTALAEQGRRPAFGAVGQLWTGLSAAEVRALRDDEIAVTILDGTTETLRLYAVRTADAESADDPVRAVGEIVDRVGSQYIVRVTKAPPPVRALIEAGIWIEKFPPILPPTRGEPAPDDPPPLTEAELTDLVGSVDGERLEARIVDLQGMSSTDGTGIGTRAYTTTGNVMAAEYLFTALAEFGLRVWYEDFVTDDGLLALNVVGEIPGRDPSRTYLVLAHYDSLNDADLSSSPGADDNATGVAAMLEIARLLAGYELAYPVRFFASNVEENGLQGVKAFAARAAEEGTPLVGAFNLDAIGAADRGVQIVLNGDQNAVWLQDLLVAVNAEYGLGQDLLIRVNPGIVADDNFLRDYGFPAILVARSLYGWSTLHHTVVDTVETIDLYNVRTAAALVLGGVGHLVLTP